MMNRATKVQRFAMSLLRRQQHPRTKIPRASSGLLESSRELSSLSFSPIFSIQELYCSHPRIRWYSSTTQSPTTANTTNESSSDDEAAGEAIYQQALEALKKADELELAREAKKSEELHRAIEKAEAKQQQHSDNPKAQNLKGVTVVKTVVKQTRKEQKNATSIQQQEKEWKEK